MDMIGKNYIIPKGIAFRFDYADPDTFTKFYFEPVKIHVVGAHISPDEQEVWGITVLAEKPIGQKCCEGDYMKHFEAEFLHLRKNGKDLFNPAIEPLEDKVVTES
jgi:hypothetical protein